MWGFFCSRARGGVSVKRKKFIMVFVLEREKGFLYNIEKIYICGNEGMRHKTRKWEKKIKLEKENERDSEM